MYGVHTAFVCTFSLPVSPFLRIVAAALAGVLCMRLGMSHPFCRVLGRELVLRGTYYLRLLAGGGRYFRSRLEEGMYRQTEKRKAGECEGLYCGCVVIGPRERREKQMLSYFGGLDWLQAMQLKVRRSVA